MADRLNAKRIEALLYLAGIGEDYLVAQIEDNLDAKDAATQAAMKENDEQIAEARIARQILRKRWLTPKDAIPTTVARHPELPGMEPEPRA